MSYLVFSRLYAGYVRLANVGNGFIASSTGFDPVCLFNYLPQCPGLAGHPEVPIYLSAFASNVVTLWRLRLVNSGAYKLRPSGRGS